MCIVLLFWVCFRGLEMNGNADNPDMPEKLGLIESEIIDTVSAYSWSFLCLRESRVELRNEQIYCIN